MAAPQTAAAVKAALNVLATPERAKASSWFFKTGKGQYGEGDEFIGVSVPQQRTVVRQFTALPLGDIQVLLKSPVHEHRLTGALILVWQYEHSKKNPARQNEIAIFYLDHLARINNWDIVDSSAPQILGAHLFSNKHRLASLRKLAVSTVLWERRVAILATAYFIREGQFDDTLALAELLLDDDEDLMHKAVGWMLREVGKKDESVLRNFLDIHAASMPRTMLRYAIEKLPATDRKRYLSIRLTEEV